MKIILIGGGGHAKVVADIVLSAQSASRNADADRSAGLGAGQHAWQDMTPVGYTSLTPGDDLFGIKRLGADDTVATTPHDGVVVAIGDNATRKAAYETCLEQGETVVSAIHPTAVIGRDVTIEPGCMICAGVVINPGTTIRANTILNTGCTVDHDCEIGPHAHVAPGVHIAGDVTVGEGGFLGIGSSVVPGVTIGEWATIGAGGAVIRDVFARATMVGVPVRRLPDPEF